MGKNAPKKRKTKNNNKDEEIKTILNKIKFLKRKKKCNHRGKKKGNRYKIIGSRLQTNKREKG